MSGAAGPDGVFFSLTAPAANLAAAGEVLADVITSATYPGRGARARARADRSTALKVALKDPGSLAGLVAPRLFYGAAPYGSVATIDSLPTIAREDLVAWREATWHPATAQIVVSGGIAPAEAQRIAEALFGELDQRRPGRRARSRGPRARRSPPRTVVIDMPEAGQAAVLAGVRAVAARRRRLLPAAARQQRARGRLERPAVRGSAHQARASATAPTARSPRAPTRRCCRPPRRPRTRPPTRCVQVILDQFAALGAQPAAADALEKRRLYLGGAVTRAARDQQRLQRPRRRAAAAGPRAAARRCAWPSGSPRSRPKRAADVARRYVTPEQASVVVVGNAAEFLDDLRKIRPDVMVIPAAELDLSSADLGG